MSEQREFKDPASGQVVSVPDSLSKETEENAQLRAERKAKLARVLHRGIITDRLNVELPPNLHGEWVSNDSFAISEAEALGFRVDTEYAKKRQLYKDSGQGGSVLGDVIFMVCDKENKELIDEIRKDEYERWHGVKKGTKPREEAEYAAAMQSLAGTVPIVDESATRAARKQDLKEALQASQGAKNINSGTIIK